jgi:hypothetical protein
MAAMTLAKLALLVGVYVSLDLSNPMMPGALAFGVEGVQSDRSRGDNHAPLVALRLGSRRLDPATRSATLHRPRAPLTPRIWQPRIIRVPPSLPAAASPSEDH